MNAVIHQITHGESISHPTYFLQSSFTPDNAELFFTSYRSGSPELHIAAFPHGEIRQLTHNLSIHPFSPALHPDGRRIFFIAKGCIHSVDRVTGHVETVIDSGAQLGECSLDRAGDWLVAAFKDGPQSGLLVCRTNGSDARRIPFPRTVIHPQFHPLEPQWIEFSGDPAPRMHRVRRDGSALECLYEHGNDEFVVHETFLGATGDLVFTVWPHSLRRMDWTTREIRTIASFNAWHITPNRAGTQVLCDTNHPDRGLFLIDAETGASTHVCLTGSSNQGTQWKKSSYALAADFAAARSHAKSGALSWMETASDSVYGPQWTHPHPAFSPDEKLVSFASDRTGCTQVYVAELS
jgi:oligogalacturonide lyase